MIGQRAALRLPRAKPTRGSQALELAHLGVGALEDRFAAGKLRQGIQDRVAPALDAGGEELRDQHVGVAVDDQAGQAVGLAVHQAQRIGVLRRRQRFAQRERLLDPAAEEPRVDRLRPDRRSRPARGSATSGCTRRCASTLPAPSRTSTVSPAPGLPSTFSTAPEKIHGWRRRSDFSRPFFSSRRVHFFFARGMRGVVDLRQRLEVEVGVDLGRGDAGVAEHLLHRAQVLRRLQHVGGERVAQHVRMHVLGEAAALRPAP